MSEDDLKQLMDRARATTQTAQQQEAQRRSFAFGNTNFENNAITRELVDEVADAMGNGSSD